MTSCGDDVVAFGLGLLGLVSLTFILAGLGWIFGTWAAEYTMRRANRPAPLPPEQDWTPKE